MLTHEQIEKMTLHEINVAISQRIGLVKYDVDLDTFYATDYTGEWKEAGQLLEMMAENCVAVQLIFVEAWGNWTARYERTETIDHDISYSCATAPEAIARCWLEWWEVTHEEAE